MTQTSKLRFFLTSRASAVQSPSPASHGSLKTQKRKGRMTLTLDNRQVIGIQDDPYRARRVKERRCASPASMILSKRGSFLKLPANLVHHGWRETFRTVLSADLTFRSSRSNTVTRCSNFIAVDGVLLPLCQRIHQMRMRRNPTSWAPFIPVGDRNYSNEQRALPLCSCWVSRSLSLLLNRCIASGMHVPLFLKVALRTVREFSCR
jgi:hypothetical protein